MVAIWRTVRVFISSTFRDMHAERDQLVKVVFPALRERLEKYRVHLVDIDLRWGVTKEQADNDLALDVCLDQIDACRPFFIGILGERYGWVSTKLPDRVASKYGWVRHHTGKSITELEIVYGVLQNPQMRRHAFFYFRDPTALLAVPEAIRQTVYCEAEPALIAKLHDLKERIRQSGYPLLDGYPARWDANAYDRPSKSQGRLVGLEAFGERVRDQLWQAIQEEFQLPEQPPVETAADPLAEEQDYHERFMESRLRVYVGREQTNDALLAFADGNDLVPCLVTGPSGSGKSAALARFVRDYQHKQPQTLVIPHFIGASPRSTNLRDLLRRFCQVFKARFGFVEDVAEEVAKLSVTFREFVGKVPADTRVLLVIDALNQLDEADRAQELYWLPTELPPHVKVIVSCITDAGVPASAGSSSAQPVLEAFRWRKHCPVQLAALSDAEQRLIIRQVPSLSAKTLDDDQVRLLLSNPATANPLFLLVALEELRGFAPYERLNERITAFPREGDTVTAIFIQVIERLAEEFNQKLVETVLTLLASARRGLSERELQELVAHSSSNPQSAIQNLQSDDLFPVLRQLRPYLLSRAGLIDFYHRNLFNAVRERYLPSEEPQRQAHARLAEYFYAQEYWLESLEEQRNRAKTLPPTPRPANVRKVDELPWQLLQAADWERSEQLLTDLAFLEAKAEAGRVFDLAADFGAAIGGMPADRPRLRILRLLEEALGRDIRFVARHPTTLFQCMWNSCWWYDCPDRAKYYDATSVQVRPPNITPDQAENRLFGLLERWRHTKAEGSRSCLWIRSLRPPIEHLGTGQKRIMRGHSREVTSVSISPNGESIISGSADRTVRIWDAETGLELNCLGGHTDHVLSVAVSADGKSIVSASQLFDRTVRICSTETGLELQRIRDLEFDVPSVACSPTSARIAGALAYTVRIWDMRTGIQLRCLSGHDSHVNGVAFSPDGRWIASASDDKTVRVWETNTGQEIYCLCGHKNAVLCVAFSPDNRFIASGCGRTLANFGDNDFCLRIWNAEDGKEIKCLRHHNASVKCLAVSTDKRWIASGSDDATMRVWDTDTGQNLFSLRGFDCSVNSISFLRDGRKIAAGLQDATVRVWDTSIIPEFWPLRCHSWPIEDLAFSADGRRFVSGSWDQTVRVWDATTGEELLRISGHEHRVDCVSFSPDNQLIASGSQDMTVRIWDADSGREIRKLCGHTCRVSSVAFSPNGRRLASGSWDNTIKVWDVATGKEIGCLIGHKEGVESLAFSANGDLIASGARDKTVRVWSVERYEQEQCFSGHGHPIRALVFSPDSSKVISAGVSWDNTVAETRVWEVETSNCLEVIAGTSDVVALSARDQRFPWRVAWQRGLVSADGREYYAFPMPYGHFATHPGGRTWVGAWGKHPYLFTLEGGASSGELRRTKP